MSTVILSSEAWDLLTRAFKFSKEGDKYCFPSVKPGQTDIEGREFVEGRDYFSELSELRRHLCAYGLPPALEMMTGIEGIKLSAWVRYANVACLKREPAALPSLTSLGDSQWWAQ
eukprot:10706392-Ditylum_brightwellii.AAC.1